MPFRSSKSKIPSVLKRSSCDRIERMSRYEMAKYKNSEVGLINTIRVCHANNDLVNELMSTGTIEVKDEDKTWENLRSQGMSFKEIINTIKMPHMALLRNLRNIFKELKDDLNIDRCDTDLSDWAKQGVFLLNTVLTVEKDKANSHKEIGWEIFTDYVIKEINDKLNNVVFILWGRQARDKKRDRKSVV